MILVSLFYEMLKARYIDLKINITIGGGNRKGSELILNWWANILSLKKHVDKDFFNMQCRFVIGNGFNVYFWNSLWMGEDILKHLLPIQFSVSGLHDISMAAMGGWRNGEWFWGDFGVSVIQQRDAFVAAEMVQVLLLLHHVHSIQNNTKTIVWR